MHTKKLTRAEVRQGVAGQPTETVIDKDGKSGFGNTKHTFSGDTYADPPCPTLADLNGNWNGWWAVPKFTVNNGVIDAEGKAGTFTEGCANAPADGSCGWFTWSVPDCGEPADCAKLSRDTKTLEMAHFGHVHEAYKI